MKRSLPKYIQFVILLLVVSACEKPEETIQDLNEEIRLEMEAQSIPSVVACIVADGQITWEGVYGKADVQRDIPATHMSIYTLMSISKLFLSTSVMQLWEQGQIDLEADINDYLPFNVRNPRYPDEEITVYMLLNHTSGLAWPVEEDGIPDFHHFYNSEEPPLIRDWLPEYILPGGNRYRTSVWKEFIPGEKWLYSNIATSLLALIVEEISGLDYRDYCRINILEVLEMHHSEFRIPNLESNLLVTPYTNQNSPMAFYSARHYPVGFLNSNLEDFSHFALALLNEGVYNGKRILEQQTIDKMLEIQNPASGEAFLWWACPGNCYGHLGGGTGFSTWAEWHFEDDWGLFIFSNKVNNSISPGGRIYELIHYRQTTE